MESLAGCAKTLTGRVPNHSPIPIAMHFLNLRELKYMEDNILCLSFHITALYEISTVSKIKYENVSINK